MIRELVMSQLWDFVVDLFRTFFFFGSGCEVIICGGSFKMICKCSMWVRIKIWIISLHFVMNSNGYAGD